MVVNCTYKLYSSLGLFVPWSNLDREFESWQCTKHLQLSVDQYAQLIPLLNTFINTHATLNQHLGWHLIDTPSIIHGQQSVESPLIFDWLYMSQSNLCQLSINCWSHAIQVSIECWKSINPDVDWVHANQNVDRGSIEGTDQHWTTDDASSQVKVSSQFLLCYTLSFCEKRSPASLQV